MKKTLIALATLGVFTGVACAASNVTLYGKIDMSALVSKADNSDATVQMKSGFRQGSRWGIKGTEDLGNGYSVGFVLEQGFNADDGSATSGTAFSRESQINVNGGFGTVAFGRFGSLASGTGSFSPLYGWSLSTNYSNIGSWNADGWYGTQRNNNAIVYRTPSFGGFQAYLEYSNGTSADTNKFSENQHYYGLAAAYVGGPVRTSLIFEVYDGKHTTNKDGEPENQNVGLTDPLYSINFGVEYNLGPVTPMFAYRYITSDNYMNMHQFGLSAYAPLGGGRAYLGVKYAMAKAKGEAKTALNALINEDKGNSLAVAGAYEYDLSKRTTLWGFAGWATGDKALKAENLAKIGDGRFQMTGKNAINFDGYAIGLGVTHNF